MTADELIDFFAWATRFRENGKPFTADDFMNWCSVRLKYADLKLSYGASGLKREPVVEVPVSTEPAAPPVEVPAQPPRQSPWESTKKEPT